MVRRIILLAAFGVLISGPALAQTSGPSAVLPDSLSWRSPPRLPGVQSVWVLGRYRQPGSYILRIKLAAGARIPPHTHPDERIGTVLKGTIYFAIGDTFNESRGVALPAGSVFVSPANVPHYIWAKDGEAMYQESGVGPTETKPIGR